MGDELKNMILEHSGGRCGYVNKFECKYCERTGCAYPLTQSAFDEIKATEQAKMQELVNKSNLERDNTIQSLRQELKVKSRLIEMRVRYLEGKG